MEQQHSKCSKPNVQNTVVIEEYRKLVRFYLKFNAEESALFWANKVASMSGEDPRDIFWVAQCMYRSRQFHRAAALLRIKGLSKSEPLCQWLAGLCLLDVREHSDALMVLQGEGGNLNFDSSECSKSTSSLLTPNISDHCMLEGFTRKGLKSAILLLKGRIYEKLGYQNHSKDCFKLALKIDVYCYEALRYLVQNQMLTLKEESDFLSSLRFTDSSGEQDLLPTVYKVLLNNYQKSPSMDTIESLSDNLDMKVSEAERLYYTCDYWKCFSLAEDILREDPYHKECLPVFIGCLVELKRVNKLFYLAHELVNIMSDKAISWFAVGCYYFLIKKNDSARTYLNKSMALDRLFSPAWLMYGHSFAADGEHDQAMASYMTASKLSKGRYLPLLYTAMECALSNNISLSERFLNQAYEMAPQDPFVIHEMGVVAFKKTDYDLAEKHFLTALVLIQDKDKPILFEKWEPLLNNLGHVCRKLKKYEDAINYYQQALILSPQNPSTLSCIGFVQALSGNITDAADLFHKALGLRRDDAFSTSMLGYVIEHLTDSKIESLDDVPELRVYHNNIRLPLHPISLLKNAFASHSLLPSLAEEDNENFQDQNVLNN